MATSKEAALTTVQKEASPFDVPQNNVVLPREVNIPGTSTGNSITNLGGVNGIYLDGSQGIYAGSKDFATAPFSVDFQGNVVANNLTLTGVISTGGAASDINSHATTVDGGKITGATITSSQIAGSTITGSNISGSTITGSNIAASTITATNLSVSTLSAITANLGTVTAGSITGVTITGGTLQTSTTGKRIVVDGVTNNEVAIYDSANVKNGTISGHTAASVHFLDLVCPATNGVVSISATDSTGAVAITTGSGSALSLSNTGTVSITGNTAVTGTFSATGAKSFDIEHPTREGYRLRYAALEGPEVLVVCRGKGEVIYPQHFTDVSEPNTDQVIADKETGNWIATAIRKGFSDYINEYQGSSPDDYPIRETL